MHDSLIGLSWWKNLFNFFPTLYSIRLRLSLLRVCEASRGITTARCCSPAPRTAWSVSSTWQTSLPSWAGRDTREVCCVFGSRLTKPRCSRLDRMGSCSSGAWIISASASGATSTPHMRCRQKRDLLSMLRSIQTEVSKTISNRKEEGEEKRQEGEQEQQGEQD